MLGKLHSDMSCNAVGHEIEVNKSTMYLNTLYTNTTICIK